MLSGYLEEIIFKSEEFNILKKVINQLSMNEIEAKDVRKRIIESKIRILNELLEFIPSHLNRELKFSQLNAFVEKRDVQDTSYLEELNERDVFITEVMQRLERINDAINKKIF